MNLTPLITDDDAVSPVIGVILMVAVTVILAAVIGAFVLGIGSQVTEATPSVNLEFDYEDNDGNGAFDDDTDAVVVTHEGGESVETDSLSLSIGGTSYDNANACWSESASTFSAGETVTLEHDSANSCTYSSADEVLLVYTTDGDSTAILGENEVP